MSKVATSSTTDARGAKRVGALRPARRRVKKKAQKPLRFSMPARDDKLRIRRELVTHNQRHSAESQQEIRYRAQVVAAYERSDPWAARRVVSHFYNGVATLIEQDYSSDVSR